MAEQSLATAALGALQACVSVLLTMAYGVAARRLRLVHETTINDMIGMGVKLFLPALILTKLGQELHGDIAVNCLLVVGMYIHAHRLPSSCSKVLSNTYLIANATNQLNSVDVSLRLRVGCNRLRDYQTVTSAPMGHHGMRLQQHNIASAAPSRISRKRRLRQIDCTRKRLRPGCNRPRAELLPCLRRGKQMSCVHSRVKGAPIRTRRGRGRRTAKTGTSSWSSSGALRRGRR